MREDSLLTGPLEPTNEWYAIAKIAGIKMCQAYRKQYGFDAISVMPTNLYGPGDNFDLRDVARAAGADPQVPRGESSAAPSRSTVWGTGTPRREFLHVDDLADACVFLMQTYYAAPRSSTSAGARTSASPSWPSWSRDVVGFTRAHRVRRQQAGRHAAQAARHVPADGTRLAAVDRTGRRVSRNLRLVSVAQLNPRTGSLV